MTYAALLDIAKKDGASIERVMPQDVYMIGGLFGCEPAWKNLWLARHEWNHFYSSKNWMYFHCPKCAAYRVGPRGL